MDICKIKALITAVELGSLTKAAETLNYTQSGLTHMMNSLEKEAGLRLIRRGRNGISLTPAGKYLMPRMRKLVEEYDGLASEVRRMRGDGSVPLLRVGAYSSVAQHWLPGLIKSFRAAVPDVDITVQMLGLVEIYELLNSGELDCGFTSRNQTLMGGLSWVPLKNDELLAVLPASYPVSGALFPAEGFDGKEFLMPSDGFDLDISPVFTRDKVRPRIRHTNMDDPAIISMVEHGLGLSVMSELVMWGRHDNVLSLPLTPPAYRELGIALRREKLSDKLVERFVDISKREIMALYTPVNLSGARRC